LNTIGHNSKIICSNATSKQSIDQSIQRSFNLTPYVINVKDINHIKKRLQISKPKIKNLVYKNHSKTVNSKFDIKQQKDLLTSL